jgi:hypothetical protein
MGEKGLSFSEAARIVFANCPPEYRDIDQTLEQIGLISPQQRLFFRAGVYNEVGASGYIIAPNCIPADADTVLRDVIDAVCAMSIRPPGDPTTLPPPPRKRR